MAILFLAVASTVNSFLIVRMTNGVQEKVKKDTRYMWQYFTMLILGWLNIWVSFKVLGVVIRHIYPTLGGTP